MNDLSMCIGDGCVDKNGCLRFRAVPDDKQNWKDFNDRPRLKRGDKSECKWHIEIKNWPANMIREVGENG